MINVCHISYIYRILNLRKIYKDNFVLNEYREKIKNKDL